MSKRTTEVETAQHEEGAITPPAVLRLLPPLFFLCVAGTVFYLSATSLKEQGYASGTPITNAALYPRLLATALLIMVGVQIYRELRHIGASRPDDLGDLTRLRLLRIAMSASLFVAYLILLPILGYLVVTPPFVALLLLTLGDRKLLNIVLFSVALTLGCSVIFQGMFNVNLPRGLFGIALNI